MRLAVMASDLPERRMVRAATRTQGVHATHEEVGTMDSALITFRREPVENRLVKDRSQWSADLIADGWPERDRVE